MTMKAANVQLMCKDLDKLLKDICDFLTTQVNDEHFSENQRLFARNLVQRSKTQLTQISEVSLALSTDADEYVDMNKPSVEEEPTYEDGQDEDNEYTPIVCEEMPPLEEQPVCPYKELSAKELDDNTEKLGPLDKKSKFFVFERQKRLFAAIKENWLLLYSTRTSPKPLESLNLAYLTAKPTEGAKTKTFVLICITTQETFHFVAQTPKDMVQWVACINKKKIGKEEVDSKPSEEDESEESENVYEPVKSEEVPDTATLRKKLAKPLPPLPKLPENHHAPYQTKQQAIASPEILEEYDSVYARDQDESNGAAEDEDLEQIYDVIEDVKAQQLEQVKKQEFRKFNQELQMPKETKKPLPPTPPPIRMTKAIEQLRTESIMSANSDFSEDDDEERIYDVLQQPPPKESAGYAFKKRLDPEPDEEYCNLVLDCDNHRLSEPEETYTNLVSIQNSINRKDSQKYTTFKEVEITEPDEEYSNLVVTEVIQNKSTFFPEPVVNLKANTLTKPEVVDVEEAEEYDYVLAAKSAATMHNKNNESKINKLNTKIKIDLHCSVSEKLKKAPPALKPKPPKLGKR